MKESHLSEVAEINRAQKIAESKEVSANNGTCYSLLCDLDYFDPVCQTIIDPMHNLFLGEN